MNIIPQPDLKSKVAPKPLLSLSVPTLEEEEEAMEKFDTTADLKTKKGEQWEGPKKLKPMHKLVLKLYGISCWSMREIADHPEVTLNHPQQVSALVRSVIGEAYLKEIELQTDDELTRMRILYVETMKEGMRSSDPRERLAAAALYQKETKERFSALSGTAEEEISEMMRDYD